jgi:hypothetical protein
MTTSPLLWARRAMIKKSGRPMTLSRVVPGSDPPSYITVTVRGVPGNLVPTTTQRGRVEVRTIGVQMLGEEKIEILDDEITAAAWPTPPARNDRVFSDNLIRTVQSAAPIYDGTLLIGWTLQVSS